MHTFSARSFLHVEAVAKPVERDANA